MKKLLKGLVSVLGVLTLLIIVVAIVAPSNDSKNDDTTISDGEKPSMSEKKAKYEIRVMDYFLSKDRDGKDVLVVDYEWTNNSDETTSFWVTFSDKVFQNGIELDETVFGCDDTNIDDEMTEIQPGAKYRVKCDYLLRDSTSPVNVVTTQYLKNDKLIDITLELK